VEQLLQVDKVTQAVVHLALVEIIVEVAAAEQALLAQQHLLTLVQVAQA
jgi:hypothetical protein